MNIVLIGYRCTGKSSVGRLLSKRLGWGFIDTDLLIEEDADSTIEGIVSERGWNEFRKIEKKVVNKVSRCDNVIISTGGGVVLDKENIERLRENGWIVWLKAEPETIKERMLMDEESGRIRPSLVGKNSVDEIKELLQTRTPLYKNAADFLIETDNISQKDICDIILKEFQRRYNAR